MKFGGLIVNDFSIASVMTWANHSILSNFVCKISVAGSDASKGVSKIEKCEIYDACRNSPFERKKGKDE